MARTSDRHASDALPLEAWEHVAQHLTAIDDRRSMALCTREWLAAFGVHLGAVLAARRTLQDIPLAARCYWEQYRMYTCGISFGDVDFCLASLTGKSAFEHVLPHCETHCMHEASCKRCRPHAVVDGVVDGLPFAEGRGVLDV
jgi:hypothetical protein